MAEHDVSLKLPLVPIEDADAVFKVKIDGERFGTLTVTKESLVWSPRHKERSGPLEVTWTAFDQWMQRAR